MSDRYTIRAYNTVTKEKFYHQLFGNNDWFERMATYLNAIGADTSEVWVSETEIPDLLELIKAIDETVVELINERSKFERTPNETYPDLIEWRSSFFDHTSRFAYYDSENSTKPHFPNSLFGAMQQVVGTSYVFSSLNLVTWLTSIGAFEDTSLVKMRHDYMDKESLVMLGTLKPNWKLTISYL